MNTGLGSPYPETNLNNLTDFDFILFLFLTAVIATDYWFIKSIHNNEKHKQDENFTAVLEVRHNR